MYRILLYCLLIVLTSCKVTTEKEPIDYSLYTDEYNGYRARYIETPRPGIKFTEDHQLVDYFKFWSNDSLNVTQYTYPHKDSIYEALPNENRHYTGYVYKGYEDWVTINSQSIHRVNYNNEDSTCIIHWSYRGNFFLKREDIKVVTRHRYYEPELIKELKIKDSLGEHIVNNPNGSRFYSYPHKDSIFPEYQYDRLNNRPTKILPLYNSVYLYQPEDHKDWLVFQNSFQFRSYDSVNDYQTNYKMKYGYVFTPKADYIKKEDARIQESLLTEVVQFSRLYDYKMNPNGDYNSFFAYEPIKIDSLVDITVTNRKEFDGYKKQKNFIAYDGKIVKEGDTLTLPITNKPNKKVYQDGRGEYHIEYRYKGEIPFLNTYIITYNDPDFLVSMLVNKTTGEELVTLGADPSISPNKDIIITASYNGYDDTSLFEISQVKDGEVQILYSFQFPHWLINYEPEIRWVNNNTFIIEAASPVHENAMYNNEKEKIQYLKIKIKDQVFN